MTRKFDLVGKFPSCDWAQHQRLITYRSLPHLLGFDELWRQQSGLSAFGQSVSSYQALIDSLHRMLQSLRLKMLSSIALYFADDFNNNNFEDALNVLLIASGRTKERKQDRDDEEVSDCCKRDTNFAIGLESDFCWKTGNVETRASSVADKQHTNLRVSPPLVLKRKKLGCSHNVIFLYILQ